MNKVNVMTIGERVHIIPLGHEYDRAVAPFYSRKADRAYVLTVPADIELDREMLKRQNHFTQKVLATLSDLDITVRYCGVNLFDMKATMMAISSLIKMEVDAGNQVMVNMSACGRKTSYAATMSAMALRVNAYYVNANGYIGGTADDHTSWDYLDHGISIVDDFTSPPEQLYNFHIILPEENSLEIMKAIYLSEKSYTALQDIIRLLHSLDVDGYEELPEVNKNGNFVPGNGLRSLLNKTNRLYLRDLEKGNRPFIFRKKVGKEFRFSLTEDGKITTCISGLLDPPQWEECMNCPG
jgi:hypothetical protein